MTNIPRIEWSGDQVHPGFSGETLIQLHSHYAKTTPNTCLPSMATGLWN